MQIIIKGKQMEVPSQLRQHIERKVQRLSRLVNEHARVEVTVTEEQTRSAKDRYTVQIALSNSSHPIRSEVSAINANAALDRVLDKVTAQLGRQKDRLTRRKHHITSLKTLALSRTGSLTPLEEVEEEARPAQRPTAPEPAAPAISEERNEEIWSKVMEIRHVPTRPMNDQEAIAEMEARGLPFYPFFNEETSSINVIYRLDTGGYGLLVPALEHVAE